MRSKMWGGWSTELLMALWVASVCVRVSSGADFINAPPAIGTIGWPGVRAIFNNVGGHHGWNPPPNACFFQAWADRVLINATEGYVLVFQSRSALERTVNVHATADQGLTQNSICGDTNLTSYNGTNHFSSNVSLQPLQTDLRYWFVSGGAGDCLAGMVFSVFIASSKHRHEEPAPPPQREVGVVYNTEYSDPRLLEFISSFGPYAPQQPVALSANSKDNRKFFYGDAVAVAMYAYNTLITRSASGASPDPCVNSSDAAGVRVLDDRPVLYYWGIYLACDPARGTLSTCDGGEVQRLISVLEGNWTGDIRHCDSLEHPVARFRLRSTTSAETCTKNPGLPYLCPASLALPVVPSGWLITVSMVLLLFQL